MKIEDMSMKQLSNNECLLKWDLFEKHVRQSWNFKETLKYFTYLTFTHNKTLKVKHLNCLSEVLFLEHNKLFSADIFTISIWLSRIIESSLSAEWVHVNTLMRYCSTLPTSEMQ